MYVKLMSRWYLMLVIILKETVGIPIICLLRYVRVYNAEQQFTSRIITSSSNNNYLKYKFRQGNLVISKPAIIQKQSRFLAGTRIIVTPVKNSEESLAVGNTTFRTVNLPFFLLYLFSDLYIIKRKNQADVFDKLPRKTRTNIHPVNRLLYSAHYTSHINNKMSTILKGRTQYTLPSFVT